MFTVTSNSNPSNGHEASSTSSPTLNQASHSDKSSATTEMEGTEEDHCSKDLVNLTKTSGQALREQLSVSERERIGRQCKRIIDTGRLHYLRSKGMKAWLRQYIDEFTTPENVVLVACQTEIKDTCS
ncbi:tRNA guanosine-2'-o-methyltransferase trm13 [Plakobranchus ocellatus]|uniref:tRNA:m(4)X modification enzyme TRM13 n=1 Tax=Plakobranchus ocellatus TaxID=259542 RepID=A0AAV3YF32_9GAST|nr:tRNA guanosine-2'-o-methyltransferase trm13 [Plakobranchus ocellatus]